MVPIEWTNQHGAGLNPNLHTDVVWQYMTDESKALVKRGAVSVLVLFVAAFLLRALLPWVLLALIAWFVWSWSRRR